MLDIFKQLFSSSSFMPHGHCYFWNPGILWLHILSDALITLAYFSIPFTLIYFVRKRKDLEFNWMFVCFAIFIVACGTTHLMEIWVIWHPTYWLSGTIKAITALASVPTAILLVRLVPQALKLPSPAALRKINTDLEREISVRKKAENDVRQLNDELERRVAERTQQLETANRLLREQIRERERAEAEIKKLNHDLEERVMNRTAQLEAANKELEAFSYSVSHDLRSPLRHIDGFVGMLRKSLGENLPQTSARYLDTIAKAAKRMGLLIDDLLIFSRMGRAEMQQTAVDLENLADDTISLLNPETSGRNITWKKGVLPTVIADLAMLRQVFLNLFSNAIKYTRPRSRAEIEVGCTETDHEIVIAVRDNGVGFDMHYADKLFGVFQRLHTGDEFEGTGIGLANVRRIISRHGGRTWAESRLDGGATFYFSLPKG